VIVANDTEYVIDCGDGVARQLVLAGLPLDRLGHVFITHHHSDHNADYGNLIWLAWAAGCGRGSTPGGRRPSRG
jgi:ribonuclease BN (tRNA processing enzyme)